MNRFHLNAVLCVALSFGVAACDFNVPASVVSGTDLSSADARGGIKGKPAPTAVPSATPTLAPTIAPGLPTATPAPTATLAPTATPAPTPAPTPQPPASGWAAKCAAEPEPTSNVLYFCDCQTGAESGCVAGNDANPGTKAAPLRSWFEIQRRWRALTAGGTLALCKGGRWAADGFESGDYTSFKNYNCNASQPCTIRDYAAPWGGSAKPALAQTGTYDGVIKFWTDSSAADHIGGFRILNLRLFRPDGGRTPEAKGTTGFRAANNVTDVEVCNLDIDGFGIGIYVGGYTVGPSIPCTTRNWKFRGNRILNVCNQGMLGSYSDTEFDGNYWDNIGHGTCGAYWPLSVQTGGTTHSMYFAGGTGCSEDNIRVVNNEFRRNGMTDVNGYGSTPIFTGVFYSQASPALKIVDGGKNWLVENNLFDAYPAHPEMGYTAIATANQSVAGTHFDGFVVRGNRLMNGGSHASFKFKDTRNLIVENNVLHATQTNSNPISEWGMISIGDSSSGTPTNAAIRNNTIYGAGTTAYGMYAVRLGNTADAGSVVSGNSVTFTGGGSGACFRVDGTTANLSKINFMDNNQCSGLNTFADLGGTTYSITSWRTASGFDINSIAPAVAGLFVNAPADFTPALGSPLVSGASRVNSCTVQSVANQACSSSVAANPIIWSNTATAKPRDTAPDIGAFER